MGLRIMGRKLTPMARGWGVPGKGLGGAGKGVARLVERGRGAIRGLGLEPKLGKKSRKKSRSSPFPKMPTQAVFHSLSGCFRPQIPKDSGDDYSRPDKNKGVERFGVEPPADQRDQRNAQEIERHHDGGVAVAERIGQAEVRG